MSTRPRTLSAGVVVVHGVGPPRYLLLRAYRYWDFPKGEVSTDEDPQAAAVREVREETGLVDLEFRWGAQLCETPPYGRGKVARYYLAHSRDTGVKLGVNPELGRPEHHECRWVDYQTARALLGERLRPVLDWARSVVAGAPSG